MLGVGYEGRLGPFLCANVQEMLGHSWITQTLDTYSHLVEGMGGYAVDGLDEAFG
jgi:hypothetical protein